MTHLLRTTSSTGNNRGFTFIEVMVALVVLSAGIVTIYKSFFLCIDYLNNLTTRIYAVHLLDERVADINRSMIESSDGSIDAGPLTRMIPVNHRQVVFNFNVKVLPREGISGLYELTVDLRWLDGRRPMHLSRSAFLSK